MIDSNHESPVATVHLYFLFSMDPIHVLPSGPLSPIHVQSAHGTISLVYISTGLLSAAEVEAAGAAAAGVGSAAKEGILASNIPKKTIDLSKPFSMG